MGENSKKTALQHIRICSLYPFFPSSDWLTNTIVEDPVIAKTVQTSTISRYHAADQRSGIALGWRYDFQNWENDDGGGVDVDSLVPELTASFVALDLTFGDFTPPVVRKRRVVDLLIDSIEWIILGVVGQRVKL